MKSLRIGLFVAVALAQVSVPAAAIWQREQTLRHGRVWKFKTAPVDPVDAVRGRYIALGFALEEFSQPERLEWNRPVYLVLKEGGAGFAEIDHVSISPVSGDNVIKAEAAGWHEGKQNVIFPFRQYWVAEKIAPEAERAYAAHSTHQKQNAHVTIRIRAGDAALEQLYIDNLPLVEYLRAHSTR